MIGDPLTDDMKSLRYKVKFKLCGNLFQLCPPKKNLEANLLNPLEGIKHSEQTNSPHVG